MIRKIGTTQYRRYIKRQYTFEIDVQQVQGQVAAHFASSMQIDADGAPKAYHEDDRSPYDNNQPCFDWLENVKPSDRHGRQGIDGAKGPAYGFTITATSLHDNGKAKNDTSRYVDASVIPYIVLPSGFPLPAGTTGAGDITDCLGCLAYVVDLISGHSAGAVFADAGPRSGEASIALALRLGRRPFYRDYHPKVSGIDDKRFFTVVFANERLAMPLSADVIQTRARARFDDWGGWPQLVAAVKEVPEERPHFAADDNVARLRVPDDKGPALTQVEDVGVESAGSAESYSTVTATQLLPAPGAGGAIATLAAGSELSYVQETPDKQWLRVIVRAQAALQEGYVRAADTAVRDQR